MSRLSKWLRLKRPRFVTDIYSHPIGFFQTKTGNWWLPLLKGDVVAIAMQRGEIFEPYVIEVASRHIKPGSVVLDVGSNYGQMAVMFSRLVGSSGTVHAFEADPFVALLLRLNIAANDAANVIVHEGAVWHESGRELFYPKQNFQSPTCTLGSFGIDPGARSGRKVRSITIDSLDIQEPISFLKIDIQGSDLYGLMGAERTIARHKMPILFEFEETLQGSFGTSFADYEKLIDRLNYRIDHVVGGINYLVRSSEC